MDKGINGIILLSILTNFAEFTRLGHSGKAKRNRHRFDGSDFYCRFDEFLDKYVFPGYETNFDYIVALFSKECVRKGNRERYVALNTNS